MVFVGREYILFRKDEMIKPTFSRWVKWGNRDDLDGIRNPGVYALAISKKNIANNKFEWIREIKYFGMTNSGGGLKARLNQFDNTIIGKEGHGGGERFRYKYRDYEKLIKKLYVSVFSIDCDIKSNKPDDLLRMGNVAYMEYYCFAKYVELFGKMPQFNNKKSIKLKANQI
ncbi:MAG: hypothetical protein ACLQBC_14005 [Syntrophales bacterium]